MEGHRRFALLVVVALAGGPAGCTTTPATPSSIASSPAPTPSSAARTPTPAPALVFPKPGRLAIGPHAATVEGISFTFEAPSPDWVSDSGATWAKVDLDREGAFDGLPDGAAVAFWSPIGVYANTCTHVRREPVGSRPEDLAAAIASVPGVELVSGPSEMTLGGLSALSVELAVPGEADCVPESLWLWYDRTGAWRWATALGDRIHLWIVEVGGARLVIEAETRKTPSDTTRSEVEDLVESIRFE